MLQKRVFVDMYLYKECELNYLCLILMLESKQEVDMMNTNDEEELLKVMVDDHELESNEISQITYVFIVLS